ncbi:MAG: hypothetical protein NC453_06850 [Muribaculum sp.]|nr:hypothetical protein [Muribaculum sp.]
MENQTKIAILWILIMFGFAFHTFADLMPIFWSQNIAVSDFGVAPVGMMTFIMTSSYLVPALGVILPILTKARWGNIVNFSLSILMLVFNCIHSAELLDFDPVQIPILPVILMVNIILSYILWKETKADK